MRIELLWDNRRIATDAVRDAFFDGDVTTRNSEIVFKEPDLSVRIDRETIEAFSDAEGFPLSVPATRWAVRLIPDYMDQEGYTDDATE